MHQDQQVEPGNMAEEHIRAKKRPPPWRTEVPPAGLVLLLLFAVLVLIGWTFGWVRSGRTPGEGMWLAWSRYRANHVALAPLLTFATGIGTIIVGAIVAWSGLGQLRTARERHEAQTKADTQRRITESFAKATEQLGSGEIAVRLGGIYTLERIFQESLNDYWLVMETLTAFVRERARWKGNRTPLSPARSRALTGPKIRRTIAGSHRPMSRRL